MIKHSLILLVTGLLLGVVMPGHAGDSLLPEIPAAQARYSDTQGCVEPTAEMRRNHMNYILHQRDETMHRGIRTKQYSLVECINCHVSDAAGCTARQQRAAFLQQLPHLCGGQY